MIGNKKIRLVSVFAVLLSLVFMLGGVFEINSYAANIKTPVSQHGRLKVKGANIVDKNGRTFQIKGMSTHGLAWYPEAVSEKTLKTLRDDWKCNTIRLAMYTEEYGGYCTGKENKSQMLSRVDNGIKLAKKLGMYVIVDWHILNDGNPKIHQKEAKSFFKRMAKKYKGYNNIIYEICNEPNNTSWKNDIKPYCRSVIKNIRKYDKKAIIICGSNTWSQDIHEAAMDRITGYKNIAYSLHFYANTHTDWLRQRLIDCRNNGLCVVVTEFGTCDASGNGGFNKGETNKWMKLLKKYKIGCVNWSLSNKSETASAIKSNADISRLKRGNKNLTQSGKLIRKWFRKMK